MCSFGYLMGFTNLVCFTCYVVKLCLCGSLLNWVVVD